MESFDIKTRCNRLIAAANQNLRDNEYNTRRFKGVNCTTADVEMVIIYAEAIRDHGTYEGHMIHPSETVQAVLEKMDLVEPRF